MVRCAQIIAKAMQLVHCFSAIFLNFDAIATKNRVAEILLRFGVALQNGVIPVRFVAQIECYDDCFGDMASNYCSPDGGAIGL